MRGARLSILGCVLSGSLAVSEAEAQTPAFVTFPSSAQGITMREGRTFDYTIRPTVAPTATVTVTITGWADTDVTLDKTTFTFNSGSLTPQTVTITAAWDTDQANEAVTLVHTGSGGNYEGVTSDLAVTVLDNINYYRFHQLRTNFAVGENRSFTQNVHLTPGPANVPSGDVTVTLTVADDSLITVSPKTLTFTSTNYGTGQPVTISGVDNSAVNFARRTAVVLAATGAVEYTGVTYQWNVSVADDDPIPFSMQEGAERQIHISQRPNQGQGTITVTLASSDPDVVTVSPATLTWTPEEYAQSKSYTMIAVDNETVGDGSASITLTPSLSGDESSFPLLPIPGWDLTVVDDEEAELVVVPTSLGVNEGGTGTYTARLRSQPSDTVTVAISGQANTDVTLDTTSLEFTTSNWNVRQTVTVTADQDDDFANDVVTLLHTATGGGYDDVTADVTITVTDDEGLGIYFRPNALTVNEGGTGSYAVELANQPSDTVTVAISGQADTDVTLDTTSLEFTTSNWNVRQTVTVTAARDEDSRNDFVGLVHSATGGGYDGQAVTYSVQILETRLVAIPTSPEVNEGGTRTYTVQLSSQPSNTVTVAISGQAGTDLSLDRTSLTFSTTDWSEPQTVTVTATQDEDFENDVVTLLHTAAGGDYDGVTKNVTITVIDDDLEIQPLIASPPEPATDEGNAEPPATPAFYVFELPENQDGRENPFDLGSADTGNADIGQTTFAIVSGDRERFAMDPDSGVLRYIGPGEDFEAGPTLFEVVCRSRNPLRVERRIFVEVRVTDVNEVPEPVDDEAETTEDEAVTVNVLANDTDPERDVLRVASVSEADHGTARISTDGRVTYEPEPDFYGVDRFTYVAADDGGLTATGSVAVTVLPVNDAPVPAGTIPEQVLDEGGGALRLDLSLYFRDVDGDELTFDARSGDAGVVRAETAGAALTLIPVVYGATTVTVTAQDPAGERAVQSITIGVSDHPQRAVLENMLAATARSHLASARAALGRRITASPCAASRLNFMGRSVPLGRDQALDMLRGVGDSARSAAATALDEDTGTGNPLPFAFGSGSGATDFLFAWGDPEEGEEEEPIPCRGRFAAWGQGDVQRFKGMPTIGAYGADYDGDLQTAHLGVDTRLGGRSVVGVALSRSESTGDWRVGSSDGRLIQTMTAIHPYFGWSGGSTSVWASVGAGRGDARNERASGKIGTSPTDLRLGLLEVEKRLGTPDALDFAFTGDASWARISTADGTETIDRQGVSVHQLRLGADLSLPAHIGAAVVTPFGAVYARRDGGAGQIGEGVEVAGGLRVVFGFVRLDGEARMLVQHSAEGYEERGAAVSLSLGRRQSEEGFSLAISPRWGDPTHATGAILRDPLRVMPRHRPTAPNRWSMDARANYAVRLPGNLRMDLTGSYGGVFGGPGFGLRIGTSGGDPPAIRPDSPTGC